MALCILACHEINQFCDIPVHYMDLNFCVSYYNYLTHLYIILLMFLLFQTLSHSVRDPIGHGRLDFDRLAQLFHSWPNSREYHISECDKVRVYSFGHNSVLILYQSDWLFLNLSLQIFLPYDINGLFILFVLDQKKKFIYILDPLSRPTWGIHIFKNMEIGNTINLALQLVNPKWNDDISKWGRKVPIVPTNSKGY